jgi:hypothetical protein
MIAGLPLETSDSSLLPTEYTYYPSYLLASGIIDPVSV